MRLDKKITESSNIKSKDIDKKSILEILNIFNSEDETVVKAVSNSLDGINDIIKLTINSLNNGGRLFYVGAGTSGRLGVLDAAECVPTFSVNSELVQGLIAGGEQAMFKSIENSLKFCNKKAMFVFDDYGLFPEIKKAVDEYIESGTFKLLKKIGHKKDSFYPTTQNKILKDYEGIICQRV